MPIQEIQNGKWTELNIKDQEYPEATKEQSIRLSIILDAN